MASSLGPSLTSSSTEMSYPPYALPAEAWGGNVAQLASKATSPKRACIMAVLLTNGHRKWPACENTSNSGENRGCKAGRKTTADRHLYLFFSHEAGRVL